MSIEEKRKIFLENSPTIAMEVLGDDFLNISKKAVELLLDLGFKIFKLDINGNLSQINIPEIRS